MRLTKVSAIAINGLALLVVLGTTYRAMPQDVATPYPKMAPIGQYLMDRTAEIALARSAAPESISRDARGWMAMFDHPEFWNPKIRAADCLNPPAARSVLPYVYKRTELLLAGHSKPEVIAAIKAAIDKKELPALEQGTVDYMMSKSSYLTDNGDHNGPHLMFYETSKDDAAWGANLTNSPVLSVNYWYVSAQAYPQLKTFPPMSVFLVGVDKWSDGTPAPPM